MSGYPILTDHDEIKGALQYISRYTAEGTDYWVALDFETSALTPDLSGAYVRLAQFYNEDIAVVIDFGAGENNCWREMAQYFSGGNYIVFNGKFESRWLSHAGAKNTGVYDVALLRAAIKGGSTMSLASVAYDDLATEMDKDEQRSDWTAPTLRAEQYNYAMKDAVTTWNLWTRWLLAVDDGRWRAFLMFNDLIPATMEIEYTGMKLDIDRHRELINHWETARGKLADYITEATDGEIKNLNSAPQWSDFLVRHLPQASLVGWQRTDKTGHLSMSRPVVQDYAAAWQTKEGNPVGDLLYARLDYTKLATYISRYGDTLINKAQMAGDNRVRANFFIAGAVTGRYSASSPPLQQLPRDYEMMGETQSIRQSICACDGNLLVSLDYAGIEVRIAAELSGDELLLKDAVYGDLHTEVAETLEGRKIDKNDPRDKAIRSKAKGGTFSLLYGAGAAGVAAAMKTSTDEGADFIQSWSGRYPRAFNLRHEIQQQVRANGGFLRCIDGGTIDMGDEVGLTHCANYPVQRAAMSVMARALIRFKRALDDKRANGEQQNTMLLATIHDQIIAEASESDATECLAIMRKAMIDAYTDMFPHSTTDNLVEGGIGKNWGALT